MDKIKLEEIKEKAFEIRCLTINEISTFGSGHIGGAMSITDLLALLYFDVMNVDPANPKKDDRDRLVVSKGHAGPAVYSTLALKGYFDKSMLSTLNQGGTNLPPIAICSRLLASISQPVPLVRAFQLPWVLHAVTE